MNRILNIWAQVFTWMLFLVTISCADEYIEQAPRVNNALVRIEMRTPNTTLPHATRSQASENKIESVRLLVLKQEGGRYRYDYMADGEQIVLSESGATLTARLNETENPLKLILIANYNDAFGGNVINTGMYEEDIREALTDSYPSAMDGKIPMYGEVSLSSLSMTGTIPVTMLRAIARVDVVNKLNGASDPFSLAEVYFFRANDRIQLVPDASNLSVSQDGPLASGASVPADALSLDEALRFEVDFPEATSISMNYIPESLPLGSGDDPVATPTCLVVGGYYNSEAELSYYRVDFDSGIEGHPFGQILRNHKYVFYISQVNSSGHATPEEAANDKAGTIVANIQIWEENTSNMYFGSSHYIGVSHKETLLEWYRGATDIIYVESNIAFNIQLADEYGEGYGESISVGSGTISSQYFDVKVVKDSSDPDDIYRILVTANENNNSQDILGTSLVVNCDFFSFNLLLLQEHFEERHEEPRRIKVLSTGTYGDLGGAVPASGTGTHGAAFRKVLDNSDNFSPTGTIAVEGFDFYTISYTSSSGMGATSAEDVNLVKNLIYDMDILHLSYPTDPSDQILQVVMDWVDASPNHILILAYDASSSNRDFRDVLDLTEGTSWSFGTTGEFTTGELTAENNPFMNGPFGEVAQNTEMGRADGVAGRTPTWGSHITPLLYSKDFSGAMTMGINQERGIIYFGDCQFTAYRSTYNAMSEAAYNDGTVSSDFDRLMANIWTWAVGRVLEK